MTNPHTSSNRRRSSLKQALIGGVAALTIGGLVAGETLLVPDIAANAQNISDQIQQPLSFADVVERVQPAVVSIRVKASGAEPAQAPGGQFRGMPEIPEDHPLYEFFRRFGEPGGPGVPGQPGQRGPRGGEQFAQSQGSGFFITADGFAVTNNHVVERAEEVTVVMTDGTELPARVVGTDPKTDLAVVKVDVERTFPFVEFAAGETRVGDWVVAVGNPFGLGGSVTAGIVSARGRDIGAGPYDDFLQIDAPINKGNSGGPAFNLTGEVIGVNTAIYSPSGGSVGIGFAIPAATAKAVVEDLMDDGQVVRGWLGVQIQPVTQDLADSLGLAEAKGALVTEPQPNGPAGAAGIRAGDAIVAVNGEPVDSARDLARTIAGYDPDTTVDVELYRDGEKQTVAVKLGTLPGEQQQAALSPAETAPASIEGLGLRLAPASTAGAGDEGVVVTEVDPDGKAAEKGLRQGDIILEVAGQKVSGPRDVESNLEAASKAGRKSVLLRVRTGENLRFVALSLDKA
ncbi:Do family serine endopeptidase [Mongoliimonas terrestris]|uniref:Do family serine endopeptidase n=1 Tax=Mongoliimonas terrestris TaxID=1709001 RepID=UPI00094980D8|nr:Do family serine endopeptidase [Mongoliimonas terrestris]